MKKILYVISSLEDSGPVRVLYNIILNIDKDKYDIYVLALSCGKKNDLKSDFESLGINVQILNISRVNMFIYGYHVLDKYLRRIKPDIVHTQCFRSTVFMQCFGSKVKLCTTIHCIFYQDFVFSYGRFIGWIMTHIYANALRKYDVCIACSETVEKLLSEKYILNLNAVRNGTQIPTVKRNSSQSIIMKKRLVLGIPENSKMFICAGVICARKNQVQILRCLRKIDDICVIFLGNGPDFEKLRKNAPKNAIFLGNVNNVYEYLSIADGFVSASFSEGMPNAVLEALMMGLPCILSNIEPHCEIKRAYSEACYLYEIDDDDDLLACFRKVIDTDITWDMHENISDSSQKLFSREAMSRKYQDIYDKNLL